MPLLQAAAMVKYIAEWDLGVELKQGELLKLAPETFDGISGIVLSLRPTDIDPNWDNSEMSQSTELQEVFGGDPLKAEEADTKN